MNASETGVISQSSLAFALPAAINLAEAGRTIGEKRTGSICLNIDLSFMSHCDFCEGYMFCAEIMPREHEMQLMMVNTIHKVNLSHFNSVKSLI